MGRQKSGGRSHYSTVRIYCQQVCKLRICRIDVGASSLEIADALMERQEVSDACITACGGLR
jgi:hypothetical protein